MPKGVEACSNGLRIKRLMLRVNLMLRPLPYGKKLNKKMFVFPLVKVKIVGSASINNRDCIDELLISFKSKKSARKGAFVAQDVSA